MDLIFQLIILRFLNMKSALVIRRLRFFEGGEFYLLVLLSHTENQFAVNLVYQLKEYSNLSAVEHLHTAAATFVLINF